MALALRMSTTRRHNMILNNMLFDLLAVKDKDIEVLREEIALCYMGEKIPDDFAVLMDLNEDSFQKVDIDYLYFVQPDFLFFKENPFKWNEKETRVAGCPDLIVEVWSDSNTNEERQAKMKLYATSNVTEFWQMDQNSNIVKCSVGNTQLPEQILNKILITQNNIKFNLTHLAL